MSVFCPLSEFSRVISAFLIFSLPFFQVNDGELALMRKQLLAMATHLGEMEAELKWVSCGDPNGITSKYMNLSFDKRGLLKRFYLLEFNIQLALSDDDAELISLECEHTFTISGRETELKISMDFIPPNFTWNEKALVVRTTKHIPADVKIGLSFGWKFLFPHITTSENLHLVLAQLESCIDQSVAEGCQYEAFIETARILRSRKCATLDGNIQWLRFLAYRIENYLKDNKDLFASRSDKGAHTVVMNTDDYDRSLQEMLDDGNYLAINTSPLMKLIHTERSLVKIF